jgi:hypothetical protein
MATQLGGSVPPHPETWWSRVGKVLAVIGIWSALIPLVHYNYVVAPKRQQEEREKWQKWEEQQKQQSKQWEQQSKQWEQQQKLMNCKEGRDALNNAFNKIAREQKED